MRAAGYTDVERGERGSTEEHLTVTQFKVQAAQQRLEAVIGQVAQAEQGLEDAKAATEKQKYFYKESKQMNNIKYLNSQKPMTAAGVGCTRLEL